LRDSGDVRKQRVPCSRSFRPAVRNSGGPFFAGWWPPVHRCEAVVGDALSTIAGHGGRTNAVRCRPPIINQAGTKSKRGGKRLNASSS